MLILYSVGLRTYLNRNIKTKEKIKMNTNTIHTWKVTSNEAAEIMGLEELEDFGIETASQLKEIINLKENVMQSLVNESWEYVFETLNVFADMLNDKIDKMFFNHENSTEEDLSCATSYDYTFTEPFSGFVAMDILKGLGYTRSEWGEKNF